MLELKNIKKDYQLKDQQPVHALKGISLNFRGSEFVAILGHSGCGKTTLLNITGGLDHYSSGDLLIKGRSTKNFNDRDWDTYRNHSVGFVFQAYNLISHQSIIKNVELALTITGIKKEERTRRAKEALDLVGLKGLYNKKPNQMSGGQMQRVAIARALVNNPEIVLADEPTGALDSETSVQIMELLAEVSKSHLVIMVTHNPELAEKYATRIVRMKDGEVVGDSNPYDGKDELIKIDEKKSSGKKKSSMGFLTAMALSASNLVSKMNRTLLVAIAGSIGIVGVSAILGVSVGVKGFISNMENDMLSSYPLAIEEKTVDTASLLSGLSNSDKGKIAQFDTTTKIGLDSMINYMMQKYTDLTNVKTNEITLELMEYVNEMPSSYYSSTNYNYNIDPTNNFFTSFKRSEDEDAEIISINGLTQQYIKTLMTVNGFESYAAFVDIFTNFMRQIPGDKDYVLSQYDMIAGNTFPTKSDEIILVVDKKSTMTDLVLAQLGYYDQQNFLKIATKAVKTNEIQKKYLEDGDKEAYEKALRELDENPDYQYQTEFTHKEILDHEFYYFPHNSIYNPDPTFVSHKEVTVSLSGQTTIPMLGTLNFILGLNYASESDSLKGTMIVLDDSNTIITNQSLVLYRDSDYVVTNPNPSVADGKWSISFGGNNVEIIINSDNKTVDPTDPKTSEFTASGTLNTSLSGFPINVPLTSGRIVEVEPVSQDFWYDATIDSASDMLVHPENYGGTKVKVSCILRAKSETNFGCLSRGVYFTKEFTEKYMEDAYNSEIVKEFEKHILEQNFKVAPFHAYVSFKYDDYTEDKEHTPGFVPKRKTGFSSCLNSSSGGGIANMMSAFLSTGSTNIDLDKEHSRSLCGLKVKEYDLPISETETIQAYLLEKSPVSISIYPRNFETKDSITSYLDRWNQDVTLTIGGVEVTKAERSDIAVTDSISLIVTSISMFVDYVSVALISFTSLSLVVSCFMIAVITFISVMERIKEIGVIRSLGGRKKDVSRLFIAENLITGLASGLIGIGVTYIIQIILNAIISPMGIKSICALPWNYALIMIALAVFLSVLSGLIPSFKASKQDPVIALRSE